MFSSFMYLIVSVFSLLMFNCLALNCVYIYRYSKISTINVCQTKFSSEGLLILYWKARQESHLKCKISGKNWIPMSNLLKNRRSPNIIHLQWFFFWILCVLKVYLRLFFILFGFTCLDVSLPFSMKHNRTSVIQWFLFYLIFFCA